MPSLYLMTRLPQTSLLIAAAGLAACALPSTEVPLSADGFVVTMPNEVKRTTQKIDGKSGPFELCVYQADLGPRHIFTVAHSPMSSKGDATVPLEAAATVAGGQLISKREYRQNGYPAMDVRTTEGGKMWIRRMVVANGRLYQFTVQMPQDEALAAPEIRFLDSIRIVPEKTV